MKFLFALVFSAVTAVGLAQDTAYQALNAIGKIKGQPFLDRLLNLEGLNGSSQPGSWRLLFEDATSRGGFREIEVRNGEIVSQRAPMSSPQGSSGLINLDRLQLDSDGAFTVAEREAARQRIGFSTANYLLTSEGQNNAPVWRVQLRDSSDRTVQTVRVSADSGRIVNAGALNAGPRSDYVTEPPQDDEESVRVVDEPESESDSTEMKIHRTFRNAGHGISNGFKHVGGSLQEIFTGRRTIDKDLPGE